MDQYNKQLSDYAYQNSKRGEFMHECAECRKIFHVVDTKYSSQYQKIYCMQCYYMIHSQFMSQAQKDGFTAGSDLNDTNSINGIYVTLKDA